MSETSDTALHPVWTQQNKSFTKHGDWQCVISSFSEKELYTHLHLSSITRTEIICLE